MRAETRTSRPAPTSMRFGAAFAAMVALGIGASGLVGWALGNDAMRTFGLGRSAMVPLGAAGLVLLGFAGLTMAANPDRGRGARWTVLSVSGLVASLAAVFCIEHLVSADHNDLDLLLLRAQVLEQSTSATAGRPSVQVVLALLLLGAAACAIASRSPEHAMVGAVLAVAGGTVGSAALVNYVVNADEFFQTSAASGGGTSFPNAIAIIALGVSFGLTATEGPSAAVRADVATRPLVTRLLPAALVVPLVSATATQVLIESGGTARFVASALVSTAVAGLAAMVWTAAVTAHRVNQQRMDIVTRLPAAALVIRDDRIAFANESAADILGPDAHGTLVGRTWIDVLGAEASLLLDEANGAGQFSCRVDGRDRVLEGSSQQLDWDGEPATLMTLIDRTDASAYEATIHLARAEAEAANVAKTEFLSRMSHELRTPLNAVLGFGQLLQMDDLTASQREATDAIARAGNHLLDMINEVLDLSRIESGNLRLSPEPVRVGDLVDESIELIRPASDQGGIHLVAEPSADHERYVLADRQRTKQVVLNFLSNAVKYNRPRGTVSIRCEAAGDRSIRLLVSDTGIGLRPDQLHRIFTPFQRLGAEATEIEGSGIGLALSKRLAEAMGGSVGVTSEVGLGSTFWCDLPEVESPVDRLSRLTVADDPHPHAPATGLSPPTILHIEDNLANLTLIERIVDRMTPPPKLVAAMQGRLGLDLARQHRPALILLDLHLPDIDGDRLLEQLRLDPVTASIPVVIVSADATPNQSQRLLNAGAAAFLTKPIDVKDFLRTLDELLHRHTR